jgi:hypothetical protein
MDRIRELLERLNNLTGEELTELRGLIVTEFNSLDEQDATAEIVSAQTELAAAATSVQAEEAKRTEAQAQAEADRQAARDQVNALNVDDEKDTKDGEATEPAADPESEDTPAAEADAETQPDAVAASGRRRGLTGRGQRPANSPEAQNQRASQVRRSVLTASGQMRDLAGKEVTSRDKLAEGMSDTLSRMNPDGAGRGDVIVASVKFDYPEDRRLGTDPNENARKIDAITNPGALVATGGICAPVNVDYTVPTWAVADRPLRDGLPSFQATRGGLTYVQPPSLSALAGATAIWTAATDASPAGATKPVITVACGTSETVLVDAVPTRLGFGNMQGRFAPEQVAANTDLAIAAAARIAENNLLNHLAAASIQVTSAKVLGATRDILNTITRCRAAYQSAYRISDDMMYTAIFPFWLKNLFRVDLAMEIGHAQTTELDVLAITDEQIDTWLTDRHINPVWHLDGQPAVTTGSYQYAAQTYAAQAAGAVLDFPAQIVWYLFPEGQIQFLDGGRLDLGVVRDSTLDATNDYETFVETFEGIAYRGFSGGLWQVISTTHATGSTSGTLAIS